MSRELVQPFSSQQIGLVIRLMDADVHKLREALRMIRPTYRGTKSDYVSVILNLATQATEPDTAQYHEQRAFQLRLADMGLARHIWFDYDPPKIEEEPDDADVPTQPS